MDYIDLFPIIRKTTTQWFEFFKLELKLPKLLSGIRRIEYIDPTPHYYRFSLTPKQFADLKYFTAKISDAKLQAPASGMFPPSRNSIIGDEKQLNINLRKQKFGNFTIAKQDNGKYKITSEEKILGKISQYLKDFFPEKIVEFPIVKKSTLWGLSSNKCIEISAEQMREINAQLSADNLPKVDPLAPPL